MWHADMHLRQRLAWMDQRTPVATSNSHYEFFAAAHGLTGPQGLTEFYHNSSPLDLSLSKNRTVYGAI
jgi:hypothetical protein